MNILDKMFIKTTGVLYLNCCGRNNKKRSINEIKAPDSEHSNKNNERVYNYLPWISIILAVIVFYLLNK